MWLISEGVWQPFEDAGQSSVAVEQSSTEKDQQLKMRWEEPVRHTHH